MGELIRVSVSNMEAPFGSKNFLGSLIQLKLNTDLE